MKYRSVKLVKERMVMKVIKKKVCLKVAEITIIVRENSTIHEKIESSPYCTIKKIFFESYEHFYVS